MQYIMNKFKGFLEDGLVFPCRLVYRNAPEVPKGTLERDPELEARLSAASDEAAVAYYALIKENEFYLKKEEEYGIKLASADFRQIAEIFHGDPRKMQGFLNIKLNNYRVQRGETYFMKLNVKELRAEYNKGGRNRERAVRDLVMAMLDFKEAAKSKKEFEKKQAEEKTRLKLRRLETEIGKRTEKKGAKPKESPRQLEIDNKLIRAAVLELKRDPKYAPVILWDVNDKTELSAIREWLLKKQIGEDYYSSGKLILSPIEENRENLVSDLKEYFDRVRELSHGIAQPERKQPEAAPEKEPNLKVFSAKLVLQLMKRAESAHDGIAVQAITLNGVPSTLRITHKVHKPWGALQGAPIYELLLSTTVNGVRGRFEAKEERAVALLQDQPKEEVAKKFAAKVYRWLEQVTGAPSEELMAADKMASKTEKIMEGREVLRPELSERELGKFVSKLKESEATVSEAVRFKGKDMLVVLTEEDGFDTTEITFELKNAVTLKLKARRQYDPARVAHELWEKLSSLTGAPASAPESRPSSPQLEETKPAEVTPALFGRLVTEKPEEAEYRSSTMVKLGRETWVLVVDRSLVTKDRGMQLEVKGVKFTVGLFRPEEREPVVSFEEEASVGYNPALMGQYLYSKLIKKLVP